MEGRADGLVAKPFTLSHFDDTDRPGNEPLPEGKHMISQYILCLFLIFLFLKAPLLFDQPHSDQFFHHIENLRLLRY